MRPILPESSWYIHMGQRGKDPFKALFEVQISHRPIATCRMVMSEVGRGVRDPKILEKYKRAWSAMKIVESTPEVWDRTLQIVWDLDRQGIVLPIQDVHIAACALEVSAVVLTYDRHFKLIPDLVATDCLY